MAVGGADEVVLDVLDKGSSGCRQELYHSIKSALVADNQVLMQLLLQTRAVSFNQVGCIIESIITQTIDIYHNTNDSMIQH